MLFIECKVAVRNVRKEIKEEGSREIDRIDEKRNVVFVVSTAGHQYI